MANIELFFISLYAGVRLLVYYVPAIAEPKNMGNGITYITEIIPYIIPVLHCMKHWSSFLLFLPPCLSREKHEIGYFFLRLFWMFEHLQRSTSFWDGICRKNDLQSATYLLRSGWKWYQERNHVFPLCISHFKWLIFLHSLDCLLSLKTCLDIYESIFWHQFWVFPNLIFDYKSSSNTKIKPDWEIVRFRDGKTMNLFFCQFFKISTLSNKGAAILFGVINFKSQNFGVHILCSLSYSLLGCYT